MRCQLKPVIRIKQPKDWQNVLHFISHFEADQFLPTQIQKTLSVTEREDVQTRLCLDSLSNLNIL